ncbi:pilus assembly protein [Bradyrhizobium diazoefficiens]|uniref:TadE/TadG family type IV pilus assembly protein n=1 Tax=Bradyrhizobium sp. WYCCWR 12699 TaxID=3064203 RepID=UPI001BA68ED4|nr:MULTISPECIES: pilus assembly protein TadG-related protein [Bradyrhizobium]MBR0930194.1 pilus assembly protein [Bradyrhizobium diazoefficiens]MDT4742466.1 pilus assembly protein TadG-related protein [Bradyrhizobium sp. WYCCWR 12699]
MLRRAMLCFATDRKANVAIIFALTMVPIIFLLGMTLDYTLALRKREQLNAAADAAAIAAVRPAMLTQTTKSVIENTAAAVFAAKANLPGLAAVPTPTITVTDSGLSRTITVSYTAESVNNFPGVLGKSTWQVAGSATAKASSAPNMNFYLLLDDSPSMALAATQSDIDAMVLATKNQPNYAKNCAFACHEAHPNNAAPSSTNKDNLTVARANNITLRIDLVTNAVKQLMVGPWSCPQSGTSGGVMQCMSALNNTTYKAAIYTFDYALNTIQTLTTPTTAGTQIGNIQLLTVDHQNCPVLDSKGACTYTTDYGTDISKGLTDLNAIMPNPGDGTAAGTPQEVVFLVTDGVEDKLISKTGSCDPNATYALPAANSTTLRCQQPLNTAICDTIKTRNIRIAILYTEYLQLPSDSWYTSRISQFNNPSSSTGTIAQRLKSCASPGLYANVQNGGDINQALTDLFIKVASSTASLVQ